MLTDDNPQRLSRVMAVIDEALELRFMGKSTDEIKQLSEIYGGNFASGGRVPLFGGGAARKLWQEFIEKLFLKASNDIRQGKGIWQGLTQEQWIKKHDDLTKILNE